MSDVDVTALALALREAPDPLPWYYDGRDIFSKGFQGAGHRLVVPLPETWHESQRVPDATARLIVAAVNALPALLAEVERLQQKRRAARDAVAERFLRWIHETPLSKCSSAADECPDWPLAYELADIALGVGDDPA